jgi:hypothetical protein
MVSNMDDMGLFKQDPQVSVTHSLSKELARLEELSYVYLARNATPALVAEISRLREKVEAWEWWDEVDNLYDDAVWSFELRQCALDELYTTLTAACKAIVREG